MILDYTAYIEESITSTMWCGDDDANHTKLFYSERGWCTFCKRVVPFVHNDIIDKYANNSITDQNFNSEHGYTLNSIWACPYCGWWEQELTQHWDIGVHFVSLRHAILRKYSVSDKEIPIRTLNKYLNRDPELLYKIDPTKMEKVVQSVFSSFFDCEIHHCGGTHDGGIDLYYVESGVPTAIQVKRRQSHQSVEPVSCIRSLLGASLLSQFKAAVFVTTADHFSQEAKKTSELATKLQLVQSFQLFDFNRFVSLLKLVYTDVDEPWKKFVNL